jgi:hypothetical protein
MTDDPNGRRGVGPKQVAERQAEVPGVSARNLFDSSEMLELDPESLDADRHYRFVHEGTQRQARLRAAGYSPVRRSDGVKTHMDAEGGAAEDLIRVGDTILMSCPKSLHEGRRNQIQNLTHARMEVPEGQFRKKASERNVRLTDKAMKGEET